MLKFGQFTMKVDKICQEKPAQARLSFIVIITMCSIILAIGLIGCILMLFRMRRSRKQRPFTMTTLVGQNPNAMAMDPNQAMSQGLNQATANYMSGQMMMTSQAPGNMMMAPHMTSLSGQPTSAQMLMMQQQQQRLHPAFRAAPIGSSQAEFENGNSSLESEIVVDL